jgi:hypothetical protein
MNELAALCGAENVASAPLSLLRDKCVDYAQSFALPPLEIVLVIVSSIVGSVIILAHRALTRQGIPTVVGNTIEAGIYCALGAYAGSSAGLLFGQLAHPALVGLIFAALAVVALAIAIMAAVRGNGEAGWKVLGFAELTALAVSFVVMAVICFSVPSERAAEGYQTYLNAMALFLGLAGALDALLVTALRGASPFAGWLLVPLNASWGALGNLLGLMHQMASFNFYAAHGKPHVASRRRFYVCYEDGFRLKPHFAFTAGSVMTSQSDDLRRHESVHVLQHLVFGPTFPLSYVFWAACLVIPGMIGGAKRFHDAFRGATQFSYYNNPWEVVAYGFGGTRHDGSHDMIFRDGFAWPISILWIVGTVGAFIGFIALRHG